MTAHWTTITPSQYPWERAALDFVRAGLPDHEPYRAWANFEFQAPDGAIYEVDLLVLTKQGLWLVEIKSRPGRVEGDAGTWTWTDREGRRASVDNPVLLANRKAKALSSLLKAKMAAQKVPLPWLDALVFLSDPDLQCDLQGAARNRVCLADREAADGRPARKGILAALVNREVAGVEATSRDAIDVRTAKALARALEQVGIRPSQKARKVGDYVLKALRGREPRRLAGPAGRARRAAGRLLPGAAVPRRPGRRRGAAAADEAGGGARVPHPPELRPPRHPRRPRLQGPRVRPGAAVRLRARRDAARPLPGDAGAEALARHAAGAAPPGRRRRPLRPLQAGHPPGAGGAERPGHGPRRRGPPPQGVQLAGRRPRGRGRLQRHGPRPGAGRSPGDRLHGPRGAPGPEGGVRGVRRLLARRDRLPPLQRAAPRREPGRGRADAGRAPRAEGLGGARRRGAGAGGADPLEHRPRRRPPRRHRVGLPQAARRRRGRADRPGHARGRGPGRGPAGRPPGGGLRGRAGAGPGLVRDRAAGQAGRRRVRAQGRPRGRGQRPAPRRGRGDQEPPQRVHRRPARGPRDPRADGPGARQLGRGDAGRAAPQGGAAGPGAAPAVRRGPAPGGRLAGAARGSRTATSSPTTSASARASSGSN